MKWEMTHFVNKTNGDRKAMAIAAGPRGELYYLDEREADDGYMIEKYDSKVKEWATMLGNGARHIAIGFHGRHHIINDKGDIYWSNCEWKAEDEYSIPQAFSDDDESSLEEEPQLKEKP